jgi:hypothetical protein
MTETLGYYCPTCNVKYVRHACRRVIDEENSVKELPCKHPFEQSRYVYAKRYKGGERVVLITFKGTRFNASGPEIESMITTDPDLLKQAGQEIVESMVIMEEFLAL